MAMRTWTFPERRPPADGPWDDEPDKAQWIDEATDLDCLIVRNRSGVWCGYVGLPPGHALHGVDYDDAHDRVEIDVHGGLTFAGRCHEQEGNRGICHIPDPGRPTDVWWLGFDCNHAFDLAPNWLKYDMPLEEEVYRTIDYVRGEVASLAKQLTAE